MQRAGIAGRAAVALALVAAAAGCDDEEAGPSEEAVAPVPSVTVPPERLTPFCQAMIDLSDELETDPPDDAGPVILDTYLGVVDEVPPEIEDDFLAVVARLQAEQPGSETGETTPTSSVVEADEAFDAEGRLPDDDPAQRLNAYVQFTCRDSQNNPGPPATEPLDDIVVDTTSG